MGLLRKRTSKASLKAKDEPRIPTPPPQLPPLPAHIRRSEGTPPVNVEKLKSPTTSTSAASTVGNRRRSRSLWGTADARGSGYERTSSLRRRDSFGSNTTNQTAATTDTVSQPWRSREAWAALHAPAVPAVLSELTYPCAPGSTAPGWRGRGGGGFFGGDSDELEKERLRPSSRAADHESRTKKKEPAPPLPTSPVSSIKAVHHAPLPSPLPSSAAAPARTPAPTTPAKRQEPPNRATTPTPELAKTLSRSPETTAESVDSIDSDSAAAYAVAAGISSPTVSDEARGVQHQKRSSSPDYSRHIGAHLSPKMSSVSKMSNSPNMDTPGLTSSPSLSAASPNLASPNMPVTPRMARRVASNDNFSPATGVLLTPNSSAVTSLADSRSTPWGAASRSATPILTRANSNSTINSVSNSLAASVSAAPSHTPQRDRERGQRLPPPSYTQSEDGHARLRTDKVEHFIEHRSSLPESSKNQSRDENASRASPQGESIDFTRPPPSESRAAPHALLASGPPKPAASNVASGYPMPSANLSPNPNEPPSRTPSQSSQQSDLNGSVSYPRQPVDARARAPSRSERSRAPSRSGDNRPPSRSASSQGDHVPFTPGAIANAVNAWRQKNGSKRTLDEGLMPGQHPSSRVRTPSSGHGHSGVRARTRSQAGSANGHGGSSQGHGRKLDKLEVSPEWPTHDVDEDPFAAAQHPWEAAYDTSDYQEDMTESPEDMSPEPEQPEEPRGPIRLPHVADMAPAGGELPPPIEPPVQTVPPGSVMQAHVQMNALMHKSAGTAPRSAQHYFRPQQERQQQGTMQQVQDMYQSSRRPSDASTQGWTPLGFAAQSTSQSAQRVISSTPADQQARSPPQGYSHFPSPPNGQPGRPRPPAAYPPHPALSAPPNGGPPQGQHRSPPGGGPMRLPPAGAASPPSRPGPQRLPTHPSGYPIQANGGPQQHVYRPTQPRPYHPAPQAFPQQHSPDQHTSPPHHAKQLSTGSQQGYHAHQLSGSSNGGHGYTPAQYAPQQPQYSSPPQSQYGSPPQSQYGQPQYGQPQYGSPPQGYAPQQQRQQYPPHPQYAQQQSKPRVLPHAHAHAQTHAAAMPHSVSIASVNMQMPQVHKSPRVQQSVAQGGWI